MPLSLIATFNSTDSIHLSPKSSVPLCHFQLYWFNPSVSRLFCPSLPLSTLLIQPICLQNPLSLIATFNSTDSTHLSPKSSVPHCHFQLYWFNPSISKCLCPSLPLSTLLIQSICLQMPLSLIVTFNSTDSIHLSPKSSVPHCHFQFYWFNPSVSRLFCPSLPLSTLLIQPICLQNPLSLIATFNSTDSIHLSPKSSVPHCHFQLYWFNPSVSKILCPSLPLSTLLIQPICLQNPLSLIATFKSTDSTHLSPNASVPHCHFQLYWFNPSVSKRLCPSLPLSTLLIQSICLQNPLSLIATFNSTDSTHLSPKSSVPHCHFQLYWFNPSVSKCLCPSLPLSTLLIQSICLQTTLSLIATFNSTDSIHLSPDSSVHHCHFQLYWVQFYIFFQTVSAVHSWLVHSSTDTRSYIPRFPCVHSKWYYLTLMWP